MFNRAAAQGLHEVSDESGKGKAGGRSLLIKKEGSCLAERVFTEIT